MQCNKTSNFRFYDRNQIWLLVLFWQTGHLMHECANEGCLSHKLDFFLNSKNIWKMWGNKMWKENQFPRNFESAMLVDTSLQKNKHCMWHFHCGQHCFPVDINVLSPYVKSTNNVWVFMYSYIVFQNCQSRLVANVIIRDCKKSWSWWVRYACERGKPMIR